VTKVERVELLVVGGGTVIGISWNIKYKLSVRQLIPDFTKIPVHQSMMNCKKKGKNGYRYEDEPTN
jgi:hypothetical protein